MADFTTERLVYSPEEEINSNTSVIFGGDYYITTASTITLPNTNMIDKGSIRFKKRQGVEPTIQVLGGSGHNIRVQNLETDTSILFDIEAEIILTWNDNSVRWEV